MTTLSTPTNVLTARHGGTFASINLVKKGDGWCSQWWVSQSQTYSVQGIAYLEIPVFGFEINEAQRRVNFIAEQVLGSIDLLYGGQGTIATAAPKEHLQEHLAFHSRNFRGFNKTERTVILYDFLKQFGDRQPAVSLRDFEGLDSARTIHDRISESKKTASFS
jgi:uncharacterized membrane protein YsdA (DUF1294 family)